MIDAAAAEIVAAAQARNVLLLMEARFHPVIGKFEL
jgi:hypothetical protein